MRVRMVNGPLAGKEFDIAGTDEYDFIGKETGKVYRYRLTNHALFIEEWPDKATWEKEIGKPDDPATRA